MPSILHASSLYPSTLGGKHCYLNCSRVTQLWYGAEPEFHPDLLTPGPVPVFLPLLCSVSSASPSFHNCAVIFPRASPFLTQTFLVLFSQAGLTSECHRCAGLTSPPQTHTPGAAPCDLFLLTTVRCRVLCLLSPLARPREAEQGAGSLHHGAPSGEFLPRRGARHGSFQRRYYVIVVHYWRSQI